MNYTPLDVNRLKRLYNKHHIAGPLLLFIIIILLAALAAFLVLFFQMKS